MACFFRVVGESGDLSEFQTPTIRAATVDRGLSGSRAEWIEG